MRTDQAGASEQTAQAGKGARNLPRPAMGAEGRTAAGGRTKPEVLRLMEAAVERNNMLCANERVVKNQGAPGADGLTVTEFKPWLQAHWAKIRQALLAGEYMPAAVRKVEITKPQGGMRTVGIPTVLDRLIQQALHQGVTWHRKPKLKIASSSRQRFVEKIRQTLGGARGRSLRHAIDQLNPVLRGWVAYFRLTEERGVLEELDGWLRRKLRTLLWRQWKRASTRAQHLMRAGLPAQRAWPSATNGRGPWWNGGASHMHAAFPQSWFDRMGLLSLLATQRRFSMVS